MLDDELGLDKIKREMNLVEYHEPLQSYLGNQCKNFEENRRAFILFKYINPTIGRTSSYQEQDIVAKQKKNTKANER